jgi:hypothetical protein
LAERKLFSSYHVSERPFLPLPVAHSSPDVSIVTEKTRSLSEFGAKLKFAVEPYYNSHGVMPMPAGNQVRKENREVSPADAMV